MKSSNETMTREEAIEVYNGLINTKIKEAFEFFAPELAESEDERIRKEIVSFIRAFWVDHRYSVPQASKWLDWFEKKKDSPMPEDTVIFQKGVAEGRRLEREEQKPTPDWMPKFLDELRSKKHYFDWDEHRDIEGHILAIIKWIAPDYFHRKEKEQKPTEILSKDEYVKKFKVLCDAYEIKLPNREYDIHHLCEDLHKLFVGVNVQKPVEWNKATINGEPVPTENQSVDIPLVEWSEEDEKILNELITIMDGEKVTSGTYLSEYAAWLRHLPERFNLQPKQEWSKIDEQISNGLIKALENLSSDWLKLHGVIKSDTIAWLKYHHNHLSWKPSEEQMEALNYAIAEWDGGKRLEGLYALRTDLKKLM